MKGYRPGNGLTSDADLAPLIDKKAYENVVEHITDALNKGGILEYRGETPDKKSGRDRTLFPSEYNESDQSISD